MAAKEAPKEITHRWLSTAAAAGVALTDIVDRPGLILRVNAKSTSWYFRSDAGGIVRRLFLGAWPELSIANAREIAANAQSLIRRKAGEPDASWVAGRRLDLGVDKAVELAPVKDTTRWTFDQARSAYLAEIERTRRPKTFDDYRQTLFHPDLKGLDNRPVSSISRKELAVLIAGVHASGREAQAEHFERILRPLWGYLEGDAVIDKSHVVPGEMARLKAPARTRKGAAKRTERTPSVEEVALLLAYCRAGLFSHPVVGLAVESLILTAQRRYSIVQSPADTMLVDGSWTIWSVSFEHLKSGDTRSRSTKGSRGVTRLEHEIPLPPSAGSVIARAAETATGPFLFPQVRAQKAGGLVTHLNESSLTHAFSDAPDVEFSPHDVRRTFATEIAALGGFPDDAAARILDHSEGRGGDVTNAHYNRHRALELKLDVLQAWQDLLEPAVATILPTLNVPALREQMTREREERKPRKN